MSIDVTTRRRSVETALRLQVFIGENDMWHHHPLHHEIVKRARESGLDGATVLHGIEGFGAASLIHTVRLLSLSEDLPVVVMIIDEESRIRAFLPELDELVAEGLVLLDEVTVVRYVSEHRGAR